MQLGMIPSPPDERDFPLSKAVAYAVAPFIKDGRTFLPLRALAEILGAKVEFTSFPGGGYVLLRWGGEQ